MPQSVSRRHFVGMGAAGGAALAGGAAFGLPVAGARTAGDDGDLFSDRAAAGSGERQVSIPSLPGTVTLTLGILDAGLTDTDGDQGIVYTSTPDRVRAEPGGAVYFTPNLPTGSTVMRVDVFGYTDVADDQSWTYGLADLGTDEPSILGTTTVSGLGRLTGAIVPPTPAPILPGQWVTILGSTTLTRWVSGVVFHYAPPAVPRTPEVVPVVPKRVYDSRTAGAKLGPDEQRTISVATALNGSGEVVPAGATAVAITITITETEGAGGFVAAFPAGTTWPGTSTVNWFGPDQNLATAAILSLGGDRQLTLRGGVARAHVVVDVTAYVG